MSGTSREVLSQYYDYLQTLSSQKEYNTYYASAKDRSIPVIIKEMDAKRGEIHQTLSRMWNPYRANIYGVYHFDDCDAAICEYVSGISLQQYMESHGCFREQEALDICIQLCRGLQDVHKVNIVHKDISPNNILSSDQFQHVKLVDFGISRTFSSSPGGDTEILGTGGFTAPEVAGIRQSDRRADLYSIGCVLNYLLTSYPPRDFLYTGTRKIEKIILRATAEDREDRYSTAEAMEKALTAARNWDLYRKVPFLRYLPGFRSQTPWKSAIALAVYLFELRTALLIIFSGNAWYLFPSLIACFFIPLCIGFDLFHVLRLIPHRYRRQKLPFLFIKGSLILLSILLGLLWIHVLRT